MNKVILDAGTVLSISQPAYPGFEPGYKKCVVWKDTEAIVDTIWNNGFKKVVLDPKNVFPKQRISTFWLPDKKNHILSPGLKHAKKANFKIGFTCGAMDLLHAGHSMMLQDAARQCDYLVVGVQSDPSIDRPEKNKPIMSYTERIIMALSNYCVDDVVLYDTESDLIELLSVLSPDVRIVGADHKNNNFTGRDMGIPIYFNEREHNWSTSNLRSRVCEAAETENYKKIMGDT